MTQVDLTTPNSKWQSIKLRLALLRIWFMKNIILWIQIFCIVCIICMLTGKITSETPLLGAIIYPLFKPLIDEIQLVIITEDISRNLMGFFASVISILVSVSMFTIKARSIAQSDIKSDKLKIALIKAKLYFNSDGKLVKKVEKMTGVDLDEDGEVEGEAVQTKGPIQGLIQAIKELALISTVKLDGNEEEKQQQYNKALKDANLETASDGLNDLEIMMKNEGAIAVFDTADAIMDSGKTDETIEQKHARKNMFKRIINFFKERKERREFIKAREEEEKKAAENPVTPTVEVQHIVNTPVPSQKKTSSGAGDYLKSLRG